MVNSTQLIELADADYKMLKETGREGEGVMHYNGYLDGFAQGVREGRKDFLEKACKYIQGINNLAVLGMPTIDIQMFREAMEE